MKFRSLAVAGAFLLSVASVPALTITENFATDPAAAGWQVFGDTNLFQWDSTNHDLAVTWDSTQPNSYFYLPLGRTVTKNDDFSISFDLTLYQASVGDTTGPLSLNLGFFNQAEATDPSFNAGYGFTPDVAAFAYYPYGFFPPDFPSPATATASFVDSTSSFFAPASFDPYEVVLPTNVLLHVALAYTAANQTATLAITTNGVAVLQFPDLLITPAGNGQFNDTNDFNVDTVSVASFTEIGQTYSSIYAQGTIGNLIVNVPPPAQNLSAFFTNGAWQVSFSARTNWLYTLESTTNFSSWHDVSLTTPGLNGWMTLPDTNVPANHAFYRIRATRP